MTISLDRETTLQIARVMQFSAMIDTCDSDGLSLNVEFYPDRWSWQVPQQNTRVTLSLDGLCADFRLNEEAFHRQTGFCKTLNLNRRVILDDHCMIHLATLYEMEWYQTERLDSTRRIFLLIDPAWWPPIEHQHQLVIDAIIHRIHMPNISTGYSPDMAHLTLTPEIVWYAQFVPLQRATEIRLGERFVLAHTMDLYRQWRKGHAA